MDEPKIRWFEPQEVGAELPPLARLVYDQWAEDLVSLALDRGAIRFGLPAHLVAPADGSPEPEADTPHVVGEKP